MVALLIAMSIVSAYAVGVTLLWRSSGRAVGALMDRWARCNGQFVACDAELNELKVKYADALMRLEDARK